MLGTQPTIGGIVVPRSPVDIAQLARHLHSHPDKSMVSYLIQGFINGFDIGYRGPMNSGILKNLRSAHLHDKEVTASLNKELARGHTLGPFDKPPFHMTHFSPLGAVPKKDFPVTYRLILDLSSPAGSSVNDGIDRDDYSVKYSSFIIICVLGILHHCVSICTIISIFAASCPSSVNIFTPEKSLLTESQSQLHFR